MRTESLETSDRRAALGAWSALTAPGALVTCAVLALALLAANLYSPLILIAPAARQVCAVLFFLHVVITVVATLWPGRWVLALLFQGLLAADALLCGLAVDAHWHGPAPLLVLAVLVMSLEAGGWFAAAMSMVAAGVGAVAAVWWGVGTILLVPTALSFPTVLAVETSYAGGAAITSPIASFPATLSVETWIAGVPAFASAEELFVPTIAVVLVALCLGLTTTMWRVRRARTAVAASIVAAARVLP